MPGPIAVVTAYVALLRAVNVGGTGKLPMAELKRICETAGFTEVRTYIASGNVVFRGSGKEAMVKAALQTALAAYAGKRVDVLVRSVAEMAAVLAANPYPEAPGNRVVAIFLDHAPPDELGISGQRDERIGIGAREIYVHYGHGMADTKLKIRVAAMGTARNMNTVGTLVEMASELDRA